MTDNSSDVRARPGALVGLRVIDVTHVIAGAYCSMILADLGADVIKVEPIAGEVTRRPMGSFRPYDFVNRNKRSIAIDLNTPEGVEVLRQLAASADILVENYRPGVLDRLGLGYAALAEINPRLIYCSISGFGHDGPYSERGGFDLVAQAMSGIMSLTGQPGAERPTSAGVPLSDLNAGVFGAVGVLAALNSRHATGVGQRVETTLLESAVAYTLWETGLFLTQGIVSGPAGSQHRLAAPYEALKAQDGYLVIGVNNPGLWRRFCEALDRTEWIDDERFSGEYLRVANRDALKILIEDRLADAARDEWLERLRQARVPCGPINTVADVVDDPQIEARGLFAEVGGRRFVRTPIGLDRTPVRLARAAAELGEDTRAVLSEAGVASDRIDALIAAGAVKVAEPG